MTCVAYSTALSLCAQLGQALLRKKFLKTCVSDFSSRVILYIRLEFAFTFFSQYYIGYITDTYPINISL